jgi:hypothetical protein
MLPPRWARPACSRSTLLLSHALAAVHGCAVVVSLRRCHARSPRCLAEALLHCRQSAEGRWARRLPAEQDQEAVPWSAPTGRQGPERLADFGCGGSAAACSRWPC